MNAFVGPSYQLNVRKADVQRVVNMCPVTNEVAGGKDVAYLESTPGLVSFSASGGATMTRGMLANSTGDGMAIIVGNQAFVVTSAGTRVLMGTLHTTRGPVGLAVGRDQFVIVDGAYGYVYDLRTGVFTEITAPGFLGSYTVSYIDGYFIFIDPVSQTFYISALENALTLDPLDFATANVSPDKLVGQAVTGRLLLLFGEISTEVWQDSGAPDFPFERNSGASIEVGLLAPFSAKAIDNSVMWLGRDDKGAGMVYRLQGLRAQRVSTMAIEQAIQGAIADGFDAKQSVAYTYQQNGHTFYCLQVPGLDTTWVFDAASQQWHERAELTNGNYAQHRGRFYCYCYNRHLIAGDDGNIYEYDDEVYTNAGDVLVRDRVSPHYAAPTLTPISFPRFELDCTVGYGKAGNTQANVQMRYSNDGGFAWSNWQIQTLGAVGQKTARARFLRCGMGRDRVWQVRCTDDVPFAIIAASIDAA